MLAAERTLARARLVPRQHVQSPEIEPDLIARDGPQPTTKTTRLTSLAEIADFADHATANFLDHIRRIRVGKSTTSGPGVDQWGVEIRKANPRGTVLPPNAHQQAGGSHAGIGSA